MFIRRKKRESGDFFYLVDNTKKDGEVKQKVICYIGKKENVLELFEKFKSRWCV